MAKLEGLGLALDGLRTTMRCAGIIVPLVPEEENAAFARAVSCYCKCQPLQRYPHTSVVVDEENCQTANT